VVGVVSVTWLDGLIGGVVVNVRCCDGWVGRREKTMLLEDLVDIRAHCRSTAGSYCRVTLYLLDGCLDGSWYRCHRRQLCGCFFSTAG
jgi:hypothetical protein